jgi:serine/threonine-protein kinase
VYAATGGEPARRVAIKVLREDMAHHPAMLARFAREAATVRQLQHPNIVELIEFDELAPGRPYYVMELLEGMDLRKRLRILGRFSPAEMLEVIEPVCLAVQAAHDAGIVHRDIKASNVLVEERSGQKTVKLLDFGVAKPIIETSGQGLTEPGAVVGTAHNMAPEQLRCERVDARVDIYALGVLIFQLLTGRHPFEAPDSVQVALQHLQSPAPRPSAWAPVTPALDAAVLRCLEKKPSMRFASAVDLLAALREAVGVEPAPSSSSRSSVATALGVRFEMMVESDVELDDHAIDVMSDILDTVERRLSGSAFSLPLRTSTSLLGVRVVSNEAELEREREQTESILKKIRAAVARRISPTSGISISLSSSVGEAVLQNVAGGLEVVGGSLLDVADWSVTTPSLTTPPA